jgi:hypothetical protein
MSLKNYLKTTSLKNYYWNWRMKMRKMRKMRKNYSKNYLKKMSLMTNYWKS